MAEDPELLTSSELARKLGLSRRAISQYAQRGQPEPAVVTPGGQYRWDLEDVMRQLREMRKQG